MEKILNFIGGELRPPLAGKFLENIDPSRGVPWNLVPESDASDVQEAVSAAKAAFPAWSATTPEHRAQCLRRLAALIDARHEEFAQAESRDNGKPLTLARALDIPRSRQNLEFFASAVEGFHGESFSMGARAMNYTEHTPLGVVVCISPWNLPLYLFTWKVAPALAAGNCVVAKASEVTPMTAFLLSTLMNQAGFPPGVFNLLHGTGPAVGDPLVRHPDVKAISFTGSTTTGRRIAEATAGTFKKLSLEMGGKNASVIFADADLERTLDGVARAAFLNQGQICLCGSRILVEESLYDRVRTGLIERARKLKIGDPLVAGTDQGALVSKVHWEKVKACVDLARQEGGRILVGGRVPEMSGDLKQGFYYEPTLIEGVSMESRTNQDEIFGPVATLQSFKTEDEAIALANGTRYGLAASIWTKDVSRAHRVARRLESGIVWINTWMLRDLRTPFGGVKESGVGREGGMEALSFFSEVKNVCVSLE